MMQPSDTADSGEVIAIDWGTSSLRAALMAPDGAVRERIASPDGIMFANGRRLEDIFRALFGEWIARHPRATILASGMIGSRQGWVEAPYAACPAGFEDLARGLVFAEVEGLAKVGFVPGLSIEHDDGVPDVMRGEETQVFGALASLGVSEGVFVLPGTHSKWVRVEGGRIIGFRTFMTGEIFDLLRRHSILGRLMPEGAPKGTSHGGEPGGAFDLGCELSGSGTLLHHLFSVRSRGLLGKTAPEQLADYMSGLIIGEEIREAGTFFTEAPSPVYLVGRGDLAGLYRRALAHYGLQSAALDDGVTFAGLFALARTHRAQMKV
jgi:2-dehydro-3-deoxygalactonokinase